MQTAPINIVFLLSYDFAFIKTSLPLVYAEASEIIISIDKNRTTWAGNKYHFDESIIDWIKQHDKKGKITIYEDDFYVPANTTMQNETRQRQLSANQFMKKGWVVQLDVDEYFLDFKGFTDFLQSKNSYLAEPFTEKVDIAVLWLNLFKKDNEGYYVVSKPLSPIRIATSYPKYAVARTTGSTTIFTSFVMVHDTWARSEEEILMKVNNWGHKDDFDTKAFFSKWTNLSKENYKSYRNFNPVKPYSVLGKIAFVKAGNITELLQNLEIPSLGLFTIWAKNIKQKLINKWR